MRMHHLVWIDRAASSAMLLGLLFYTLAMMGVIPAPYSEYAPYGAFLGVCVALFVRICTILWGGSNVQCPDSPEGYPVEPSGRWVDEDTELEIGTKVLAYWQGKWWRAMVIGFKSGDRVIVHYLGWSEVWDEPHRRKRLQLAERPREWDLESDDDELGYSRPRTDDAIRPRVDRIREL